MSGSEHSGAQVRGASTPAACAFYQVPQERHTQERGAGSSGDALDGCGTSLAPQRLDLERVEHSPMLREVALVRNLFRSTG